MLTQSPSLALEKVPLPISFINLDRNGDAGLVFIVRRDRDHEIYIARRYALIARQFIDQSERMPRGTPIRLLSRSISR